MTSAALHSMNYPAISMLAAGVVFFLAHANEKQAQANWDAGDVVTITLIRTDSACSRIDGCF
jgi:hypothetical protein